MKLNYVAIVLIAVFIGCSSDSNDSQNSKSSVQLAKIEHLVKAEEEVDTFVPESPTYSFEEMKDNFDTRVHFVEQFIAQYNGLESTKGMKYSVPLKGQRRLQFRKQLVSSKLLESEGQHTKDFLNEFENNENQVQLSSHNTYCLVNCNVSLLGKSINTDLVFQLEETDKIKQWGLVGVGPEVLQGSTTNQRRFGCDYFSVEVGFHDLLQNKDNPQRLISKFYPSSRMHDFMELWAKRKVSINSVNNTRLLFLQLKDWVFSVSRVSDRNNRTGWLVTSFESLPEIEKGCFIENRLGLYVDRLASFQPCDLFAKNKKEKHYTDEELKQTAEDYLSFLKASLNPGEKTNLDEFYSFFEYNESQFKNDFFPDLNKSISLREFVDYLLENSEDSKSIKVSTTPIQLYSKETKRDIDYILFKTKISVEKDGMGKEGIERVIVFKQNNNKINSIL